MKKLLLIVFTFILSFQWAFSDQGMWIPLLLKQLNEAEMQSMGMKMTAEDVYSVNRGSLKDAIIQFGGGCTGEIISARGLLLTNHHCGYGRIQSHSTLENNYLEEGFWAASQKDELPNPGLGVTFIDRIEDVTKVVLMGVTDEMDSRERQSQIDKNISAIRENTSLEDYQDMLIRPFYYGNQYFMFVTITYNDIRLVGAPPSSIGKFGADTDNWEWPRHTGDFSLFRIYADKNNLPADYSEDNVPFTPKHFLPISLDGVEEGDFTLVFGFPGRTQQYLPGVAVEQLTDVLNPAKIGIRDRALKVMDAAMRADEQVKIQYASQFASIANYWKKWIGESQGLRATNALDKKRKFEKTFTERVQANPEWKKKYGNILPEFEKLYREIEPYALTRDCYGETFSRNVDLFTIAGYFNRLVGYYENNGEAGYNGFKSRLEGYLMNSFYKNYNAEIDQKVLENLLGYFAETVTQKEIVAPIDQAERASGMKNYEELANYIYNNTFLTDPEKVEKLFQQEPEKAVEQMAADPAIQFASQLKNAYDEHSAARYNPLKEKIDLLQRQYMKALMEVFPEKRFFPDANSTLRVSYGKVEGYKPRDAVKYTQTTYLEGVMEKYKPGDYEFDVPSKLQELYEEKDYGQYGVNGRMPVCFLGSNHTTGGNSGSPAIDAYGNLIGLNFDRVWEGTMSDINYDRSICRNIMVDVRYVLFIIDKYAGAGHLIEEMKLVRPKSGKKKKKTKKKGKKKKMP